MQQRRELERDEGLEAPADDRGTDSAYVGSSRGGSKKESSSSARAVPGPTTGSVGDSPFISLVCTHGHAGVEAEGPVGSQRTDTPPKVDQCLLTRMTGSPC